MKIACLSAALLLFAFTPIVQQDTFKPLHQLCGGTWKMKTGKGFTCEQWKKVSDTELSGMGFRITGKDTTVEEHVQLVITGNYIFYNPIVSGQNDDKPVPFKLTSSYKGTYLFINPEHDYPQVVAYQFIGKDSLNAWIDGSYQGKKKRIDFHYRRIN
ncbi:MAG: DUF6265 family protein [Bacteroidota bacterium]